MIWWRKKVYKFLKQNVPLYRELPFIWRPKELQGLSIKGVVDAILRDGIILDYKTGDPNDEILERYWLQLRIYYFALKDSKISISDEVMLIFLDKDEIINRKISHEERNETLRWIRQVTNRYLMGESYEW